MTGSTFKRTTRSQVVTWGYSIYLGKDEGGKVKRQFKSGFETEREAKKELRSALNALDGYNPLATPKNLGEFLDEWIREHVAENCSPKTAERYRQHLAKLHPDLLAVSLRQLDVRMLEREYTRLRRSGGQHRTTKQARPLSARSVRHIANTVQAALNRAVKWKLIPINPSAACDLPKAREKEAVSLDATKTQWFIDAARSHPYLHPVLKLAAATGCRRGELLALAWSDVNLVTGFLPIRKSLEQIKAPVELPTPTNEDERMRARGLRVKSPKNGKARTFRLPPSAVEALRVHRQRQDEIRSAFGEDYRDDLDLIFATPQGVYLKPDSVTASACLLAKRCGLEGVGLHSLRHSFGSQLLSVGIALPEVSRRLGHSNPAITARVYSHAMPADDAKAADAWDL